MKRLSAHRRLSRRDALKLGAASVSALSTFELLSGQARAQPMTTAPAERLLFVFCATGGGNITDCGLAVTESEVTDALGDPAGMLCYPSSIVTALGGVNGGGFADPTSIRAVDVPNDLKIGLGGTPGTLFTPSEFFTAHLAHAAVMTVTNTSVNHFVAQHRAVSGAGIHGGKTLGEAMAERYGQSLSLPFVNMGTAGYLENGASQTVPAFARGEPVVVPGFFAASTDAMRGVVGAPGGVPGSAPQVGQELDRARALIARARAVRGDAEAASIYGQTYACSDLRARFEAKRAFGAGSIEPDDLITNLLFATGFDLAAYGLEASPAAATAVPLVETMSGGMANRDVNTDPFLAQVVLAYLAARYGYTAACNLGLPFSTDIANLDVNPPLSFDNSHGSHVVAQAQMWCRLLDGVDKLIRLLQMTPVDGGTLWDRSLIYIASDFGRDRIKDNPQLFSSIIDADAGTGDYDPQRTGHHLNNGAVLVSPLLAGGRVYGGIQRDSLLTYGFDPVTGTAVPGSHMGEGDLYSVVCQALGVEFPGRRNIPVMLAGG